MNNFVVDADACRTWIAFESLERGSAAALADELLAKAIELPCRHTRLYIWPDEVEQGSDLSSSNLKTLHLFLSLDNCHYTNLLELSDGLVNLVVSFLNDARCRVYCTDKALLSVEIDDGGRL